MFVIFFVAMYFKRINCCLKETFNTKNLYSQNIDDLKLAYVTFKILINVKNFESTSINKAKQKSKTTETLLLRINQIYFLFFYKIKSIITIFKLDSDFFVKLYHDATKQNIILKKRIHMLKKSFSFVNSSKLEQDAMILNICCKTIMQIIYLDKINIKAINSLLIFIFTGFYEDLESKDNECLFFDFYNVISVAQSKYIISFISKYKDDFFIFMQIDLDWISYKTISHFYFENFHAEKNNFLSFVDKNKTDTIFNILYSKILEKLKDLEIEKRMIAEFAKFDQMNSTLCIKFLKKYYLKDDEMFFSFLYSYLLKKNEAFKQIFIDLHCKLFKKLFDIAKEVIINHNKKIKLKTCEIIRIYRN